MAVAKAVRPAVERDVLKCCMNPTCGRKINLTVRSAAEKELQPHKRSRYEYCEVCNGRRPAD